MRHNYNRNRKQLQNLALTALITGAIEKTRLQNALFHLLKNLTAQYRKIIVVVTIKTKLCGLRTLETAQLTLVFVCNEPHA